MEKLSSLGCTYRLRRTYVCMQSALHTHSRTMCAAAVYNSGSNLEIPLGFYRIEFCSVKLSSIFNKTKILSHCFPVVWRYHYSLSFRSDGHFLYSIAQCILYRVSHFAMNGVWLLSSQKPTDSWHRPYSSIYLGSSHEIHCRSITFSCFKLLLSFLVLRCNIIFMNDDQHGDKP